MHMHMCMYQSRRSLPPVPLDIPRPQPRGNAQQPAAATAFRHAWAATYHSRTQAQGAFARLLAERCGAPRPLGRLSRKPFKKSRFELSYPDGLFGCTNDGEDQDEADADLERRAWWRGHAGQATYVGWDQSHASMCELWEREQFDGIIGFSQGAAAAAMLCAELKPRFGIFVAGFVPNDQEAAALLLAGVDPCGRQDGSAFGLRLRPSPSASALRPAGRPGGSSLRQTMPPATRSFDQPRPISLCWAAPAGQTGLVSHMRRPS